MSEEKVAITDAWQLCGREEETGCDVPFTTFTWAHWLEMQAKMVQCLTRYQRAVEHQQAQVALLVVLEIQQLTTELYKEACTWVGVKERE
jgi:hypothetical protein